MIRRYVVVNGVLIEVMKFRPLSSCLLFLHLHYIPCYYKYTYLCIVRSHSRWCQYSHVNTRYEIFRFLVLRQRGI